jgi:alkylation response protein AidB-like acyl-CoA dehydrogenase
MKDWNALSDADFRTEIRAFVEKDFPPHLRNHPRRIPRWETTREWFLTLSANGMLAPNWPAAYGGMGLSASKMIIYFEELERWGVPRIYDMGLYMLGPILIRHGTDAQKSGYLPRILSGEHRWAQGYSEPGAGSDLASLRTTAVPDGDHYVINGQKTWTTFLDDATHMFLLARTRKDGRKQEGLTIFILNLDSPGVQRRLITTLSGHAELGEVFLDNVRVPAANIVGPLHGGWTAAKDLLEFERINNGSPKLPLYALNQLNAYARARGLFDDPAFRDRFTRLRLDLQDQYCAYRHFCNRLKSGRTPGPEVSMLKLWSTETYQRLSELFLEVAGEEGVEADLLDVAGSLSALRLYYRSRPSTIYSGSSEVQRNLLAKRVLKLPGARP